MKKLILAATAALAFSAQAALYVNDPGATTPLTGGAAANAIRAEFAAGRDVTVTGSETTSSALWTVAVPEERTLVWKAEFKASIANAAIFMVVCAPDNSNGGKFEIAAGANIERTGTAGPAVMIACPSSGVGAAPSFVMTGGKVSSSGRAIASEGDIVMTV